MRKIDKTLYDAICNQKEFNKSNTLMIKNHESYEVYLHHNMIASIAIDKSKISLTDAGWATQITRRRLQAILDALGFTILVRIKKDITEFVMNGTVIAKNSLTLTTKVKP